MSDKLVNHIVEMEEEEALALAKGLLDAGTPPMQILDDCRVAMEVVGGRFEEGQYFIPELILAGEMLKSISEEVKPYFKGEQGVQKRAKAVVGTVKGDIHDIGKDIVVFMLDVNGFEVTDLGVDVAPEKFVEAVKGSGAKIVGLSGFLTLAFNPMKDTVAAIKAAGLDDIKIMIGGGQIDENIRQYTGADAYGADAVAAVALAKEWVKE